MWTIFKVFTEFVTVFNLTICVFGPEACGEHISSRIEYPPALEGEVLITGLQGVPFV